MPDNVQGWPTLRSSDPLSDSEGVSERNVPRGYTFSIDLRNAPLTAGRREAPSGRTHVIRRSSADGPAFNQSRAMCITAPRPPQPRFSYPAKLYATPLGLAQRSFLGQDRRRLRRHHLRLLQP